jgi:hypothetical protein
MELAVGKLMDVYGKVFVLFFMLATISIVVGMWYGDKTDGSSKRKW